MAPQTAISKAVCYKTKNEQLWEKAVHFLLVATNCFYAGLPTVFCTITIIAEGCKMDIPLLITSPRFLIFSNLQKRI